MKSRVLSVHQEHEVLLKLEQAGLGDSEAQAIVQAKGNALAKKIVQLIHGGRLVVGGIDGVGGYVGDWKDIHYSNLDSAVARNPRSLPFEEVRQLRS